MKLFLLMITTLVIFGCGETTYFKTRDVPVEVTQKFEGLYYFEELASGAISGPVEIVADYNNELDVVQHGNNSKLRSQNFNGTFGTHPRISLRDVVPGEAGFVVNKDQNYSNGDDLEEDGTNNNLGSGKHFTVYQFYLDDAGLLNLVISIHEGNLNSNGGINDIVIKRTFREAL